MAHDFPFAQRTGWELSSNRFSVALERLRRENAPVIDMTESNPTRCGLHMPRTVLLDSLADDRNALYEASPRGNPEARGAVARYYQEKGFQVVPEDIFLTASTSEAYTYLLRLLADPEDRVLFPRPSYPLFSFLGNLNDVRLDTYPLVYTDKWQIDAERLRASFKEPVKAVVVVNPNNPTGSFICREELDALNTLCQEQRAAIISDEVFADFAFDAKLQPLSLVSNDRVLTFVLGGISKTLGLPQMKLSWIVIRGPRDLAAQAAARLEVIADTYLSVNTPVQNALPRWMEQRNSILEGIRKRIMDNWEYLTESLREVGTCRLLAAQGGWYAVLEIPTTRSEEEWVLTLLEQDHVALHPGYFYDFEREAYLVLSLLLPQTAFRDGVERILRRLANSRP